jgi:hypothetical protein
VQFISFLGDNRGTRSSEAVDSVCARRHGSGDLGELLRISNDRDNATTIIDERM